MRVCTAYTSQDYSRQWPTCQMCPCWARRPCTVTGCVTVTLVGLFIYLLFSVLWLKQNNLRATGLACHPRYEVPECTSILCGIGSAPKPPRTPWDAPESVSPSWHMWPRWGPPRQVQKAVSLVEWKNKLQLSSKNLLIFSIKSTQSFRDIIILMGNLNIRKGWWPLITCSFGNTFRKFPISKLISCHANTLPFPSYCLLQNNNF